MVVILCKLSLRCDHCGLCFEEEDHFGINVSRRYLRAAATRDGWTRREWGERRLDLCKSCSSKQDAQNA